MNSLISNPTNLVNTQNAKTCTIGIPFVTIEAPNRESLDEILQILENNGVSVDEVYEYRITICLAATTKCGFSELVTRLENLLPVTK